MLSPSVATSMTSLPPNMRKRPLAAAPPVLSVSTHAVLHDRVPLLLLYETALNWSRKVPAAPVVSAVVPATPVVWSHALKVRPFVTVPFQSAFGTKRTNVLA